MDDSQQQLHQTTTPTKPPDIGSMQIDDTNMLTQPPTFLQTLLTDKYLMPAPTTQIPSLTTIDLTDEVLHNPTYDDTFIPITSTDKTRLYEPWKYSIIVKIFGKRITHQIMHDKLMSLWKPTEALPLIDLGSDFFLIKFQREENMHKALHGGPWLPELPTEFYDLEILGRIGSKLGQLLKIDICTSSTTRGRYARICIEVPLEKPLKTHLYIGNHRQSLLYEGLNLLCTNCGRFGHPANNCPESISVPKDQNEENKQLQSTTSTNNISLKNNEWKR
uniref:CCHC-type domain-containing protein n=1 Tax=Nicotiana tabacum TaxID=4097 RepID=A0A1S3ZTS4_TOBAC|nr:PREDICTED: uncharacterized protein LOC107790404 [Nicotiana tabacum]